MLCNEAAGVMEASFESKPFNRCRADSDRPDCAERQRSRAGFIDARLLSEIDKSGYIDKLYGGTTR
jgi:hypothetical protein